MRGFRRVLQTGLISYKSSAVFYDRVLGGLLQYDLTETIAIYLL